jgi:hypothetical protein
MPYDFLYELQKCKAKGTFYYVEHWEYEVILH